MLERVRVDGGDVARKFGELGGVGDIEHRIQDEAIARSCALGGLSQGGGDKLGVRRAVLDAQLLDEGDEVLFILGGESHISRVFVTLPPKEACDLVARHWWGGRKIAGEVGQNFIELQSPAYDPLLQATQDVCASEVPFWAPVLTLTVR